MFSNKTSPVLVILVLFCFLTVAHAGTPPVHDNLIYSGNLSSTTDQNIGTITNRAGQFITGQGWKATGTTSQLKITLPDDLPFEGTLAVKVTNFNPATQNGTAGKQHIINLYSRSEGTVANDNPLGSWMNIRTGTEYSDGDGMAGFKFISCADGATQTRQEVRTMQNATWSLTKTYDIKIVWTKSSIFFLVDDVKKAEAVFNGQIEQFRYIFLGTDNKYVAQVGPIYSDLRIYTSDEMLENRGIDFTDITSTAGVAGILPEGYGHGVSFNDVNKDGLLDIFYTNAGGPSMSDVLYINQGNNKFINQASSRRIPDTGHTHGVVSFDVDNDGDLDVFMSNQPVEDDVAIGRNRLYRNDGNGNFTDITEWSGLSSEGYYSRGAVALDVNNDGNLDLYVVNWAATTNPYCDLNELYLGDGTGKMTRVHQGTDGPADDDKNNGRQGITAADFDNDGDLDIYVCRREMPNWLFVNDGTGHFTDEAAARGVAVGGRSHGATFVDIDNDGDLDLFVMNYSLGGSTALPQMYAFLNNGNGTFTDISSRYNINVSGYSIVFGDIDNDADMDMYLIRNDEKQEGTTPKLYLNDGKGNLTYHYEPSLEVPAKGARGAAYGDIDNDGDIDFFIACTWGPNYLLRNDLDNYNHYLDVLCIGPKGDYGGFGSKVSVYAPGHMDDPAYLLGYQEPATNVAYMSQNQTALHFGLGTNTSCDVKVQFLNGVIVRHAGVAGDAVLQVTPTLPVPTTLQKVSSDTVYAAAGQPVSDSIRVRVVDEQSRNVANHPVSFSVTQGNGTLNGTTSTQANTETNSNGIAAVSWRPGTVAGAVKKLSASASNEGSPLANSPLEFTAIITSGSDTLLLKQSGDNQFAAPGVPLADSIKVFAHDQYNNPQPNTSIRFQVLSGNGNIDGNTSKTVKTNKSGFAAVQWIPGNAEGINAHTLQASLLSNATTQVLFTASTSNAPIKEIRYISGNDQSGIVANQLAAPFVVQLLDSLGIARSGFTITFNVISGGGNIEGATEKNVITDSNGKAQIYFTLGQVAGNDNQLVRVSCAEINDVINFTASALADVASRMEKTTGDNQGGALYETLPIPLTIKVTDKYSNPVAGQPVVFSTVNNMGSVNDVASVTINTNGNGLAQVTFKLGSASGLYYINAVSSRNNTPLTGSPAIFTATANTDPSKLTYVSGDSATGVINKVLPVPLQVKVTDENGFPVADYNVLFVSTSGGGSFDGNLQIQQPTNSQGVASVYPTLGNRVGKNIYVFNARAFGDAGEHLQGSPITFNISAKKSAADKIVLVAGNNQSGQAGAYLSSSIQVAAKDTDNNFISNHDVTFTVHKGSGKLGNSQVSALTIKTDANGIAKTELKLGSDIGDSTDVVKVTSDDGLASLLNSPLTVVASAKYGQPDSIASLLNISDSVVPADGQSQLVVTVQLKDQKNNPVPGESVLVQVSGANNTITQPSQLTDANGLATARITTTKAGKKVISASVQNKNITIKQTKTVDFVAGSASSIVIAAGNNQTGAINSSLPIPLTVRITDAQGNAVNNHMVTFAVANGGGTIATTQPIFTDTSGLAKSVWILGPTIGEQTVQVTALNISGSAQFKAQAAMPAIANIIKIKGDEQFVKPGALFPDSLVVKVVDANQSPISAIPITFTVEQGDASFTSTSHINSDSYGLGRVRLAAGSLTGPVKIKASINETLFVEFNCSISVSLPDTIIHVLGNGSESAVGTTVYPLTVKVLDNNQNPISGVAITFSAHNAQAAIEEEQPLRTSASGMASAHARLGTKSGTYLFTAENSALHGSPVQLRVKALPDNAVNMQIVAGNNQTGDALKVLPQQLKIKITDKYGNGVPDVSALFNVTSGNGQIMENQPVTTDSSGYAACQWRLGTDGVQTVSVTSPVLPQNTLQFTANLRENQLPQIHVVSDTSVVESNTLIFTVTAVDPEGGEVTFGALQLPTTAVFDSLESHQFSWTPNYSDQGDHVIIFKATDENGGVTTKTVTIHVINVNRKPGIVATEPNQSPVNAYYNLVTTFKVTIVDADKDPLYYRWYVNNNYIKSQDDSNYISVMPNKTWPLQFTVQVFITDKIDTISHYWNVNMLQTKVELSSFAASSVEDKIKITWQTRNAFNTAGFYIQRSSTENGLYTRRNASLIQFNNSNEFDYLDYADNGCRDYYYKLEEITLDGESFTFDPIRVKIEVPDANRLLQNYPNPFNPETTLKYELKSRQYIEINIFNISGQLIRTLYCGEQEAGYHHAIWNGRNDNDMQVSSGLYYCCMSGDHYRQTIKLLLLK